MRADFASAGGIAERIGTFSIPALSFGRVGNLSQMI